MTVYPPIDEVLIIHHRLISLFGGAHGVRDRGAIEAALARPQSGYYRDVIEEAAALLESLSDNHGFLDGNKRTAITVTAAFLRVNGYRLEFSDFETYNFVVGLCQEGQFRFGCLQPWLREHVKLNL